MDRERLRAGQPQGTVPLTATIPPSGDEPPDRSDPPSAAARSRTGDLALPRRFGRYELREVLGRGGMGEVYRAHDTVRDREVAVKLLATHLAADESFRTRFRRESQVAAQLADPHIIPIHDFGEIDGRLFIDMRLVEGHDLNGWLRDHSRAPVPVAVDIVEQVAGALDAAHARGLVHRDVKPSNVLLAGGSIAGGARPFAYLVDFGIARPMASDGTGLTTSSGAYGTVGYLAPERIRGEAGDQRTDVYALGCVLFELLTGRRPWDGDIYTVLSGHVTAPPPAVTASRPDCPPALDHVVRRAMAKRPDDRFATAGEFARAAAIAARSGPLPTGVRASVPPVPPTAPPTSERPGPRPPRPGQHPPPQHRPAARRPPARRARVTLAVLAVLVLAAGVVTTVALSGHNDVTAGRPPSGSASPRPSALYEARGTTVAWRDFRSFSALLGTRNNDTAASFQNAGCKLRPREEDDPAGLVEAVVCQKSGGNITFFVGRFSSTQTVQTYLRGEMAEDGYRAQGWGQNGVTRGLTVSSPARADPVAIDTVVCGLPTYVVRFNALDPNLTPAGLREQVWGGATFPDVVPPACKVDFSAATGKSSGDPMTPSKPTVQLTKDQTDGLLRRFVGSGDRTTGFLGTAGTEIAIIAGRGVVEFWGTDDTGLGFLGTDSFKYRAGLPLDDYFTGGIGPLRGMTHSVFVVRGLYDSSGVVQAIVYTRSKTGDWSPAELRGDRLLFGTGSGTIFREVSFGDDQLTTQSCSKQVPASACAKSSERVIVRWRWDGTGFTVDKRSGRPR